MTSYRMRDHNRLDDMSKYAIWNARIMTVLEDYGIRYHAKNLLSLLTDVDALNKFN